MYPKVSTCPPLVFPIHTISLNGLSENQASNCLLDANDSPVFSSGQSSPRISSTLLGTYTLQSHSLLPPPGLHVPSTVHSPHSRVNLLKCESDQLALNALPCHHRYSNIPSLSISEALNDLGPAFLSRLISRYYPHCSL